MNKTPTTWLDIVKKTSSKVAKGTGLKEILPIAKKEWALIKSGKHPTMMVGTKSSAKNKTKHKRKSHKRKSRKRKSRKRKSHKRKR